MSMQSLTASIISISDSMPILTASTSISSNTALIWSLTIDAETLSTLLTPRVFWAVIAVMADIPYTPMAANVFRSV